jgi:hypothetical protein
MVLYQTSHVIYCVVIFAREIDSGGRGGIHHVWLSQGCIEFLVTRGLKDGQVVNPLWGNYAEAQSTYSPVYEATHDIPSVCT